MDSSNSTSATADFCNELRKAREFRGLSLLEIEQTTRISRDYLAALEAGEWERIPAPILRGVVSAYAARVGMNLDRVLREYDRLKEESSQTRSDPGLRGARLREPMMVGMTRTQIRTAWFARLVGNRALHWAVTVLGLAMVFVAFLNWPDPREEEFKQAARGELRSVPAPSARVREPFRTVTEADSLFEEVSQHLWPARVTTVVATDTGLIVPYFGIWPAARHESYPFDTIRFIHRHGLRLSSHFDQSLLVLSGGDTVRPHFSRDSSRYWCIPDRADSADLTQKSDSLTRRKD